MFYCVESIPATVLLLRILFQKFSITSTIGEWAQGCVDILYIYIWKYIPTPLPPVWGGGGVYRPIIYMENTKKGGKRKNTKGKRKKKGWNKCQKGQKWRQTWRINIALSLGGEIINYYQFRKGEGDVSTVFGPVDKIQYLAPVFW